MFSFRARNEDASRVVGAGLSVPQAVGLRSSGALPVKSSCLKASTSCAEGVPKLYGGCLSAQL